MDQDNAPNGPEVEDIPDYTTSIERSGRPGNWVMTYKYLTRDPEVVFIPRRMFESYLKFDYKLRDGREDLIAPLGYYDFAPAFHALYPEYLFAELLPGGGVRSRNNIGRLVLGPDFDINTILHDAPLDDSFEVLNRSAAGRKVVAAMTMDSVNRMSREWKPKKRAADSSAEAGPSTKRSKD
jgi:hypothetical protein